MYRSCTNLKSLLKSHQFWGQTNIKSYSRNYLKLNHLRVVLFDSSKVIDEII
jgi:hypothetical protein